MTARLPLACVACRRFVGSIQSARSARILAFGIEIASSPRITCVTSYKNNSNVICHPRRFGGCSMAQTDKQAPIARATKPLA